jgi:hypothetical protein
MREDCMKKAKRVSLAGVLPVLALGLAFLGLFSTSGEAQKVKTPKPPQIVCDNNGNCEYAEVNWFKSRVDQPCSDCQPKVYGPLMISESQLQIAGWNTGSPSGVFLCQYTGNPSNEYKVVWESAEADVRFNNVRIGDIDNDGQNEIVAIHTITTVTGKGKNQQTTYSSELLIFEDGAMREPTSRLSFVGLECYSGLAKEIRIANVDNDPGNELVVMKSGMDSGVFEVYRITPAHEISRLYSSEVYGGGGIWSLEVGNADNTGANEILLSRYMTTRPFILKFAENPYGWVPVNDVLIDETGTAEAFNDDGTLNFNIIKVSDLDGDEVNEIIAGGNSGWLMIWNYIGDRYVKVFSEAVDPEHTTWALDVGNIDEDSGKEIVIGLGSGGLILDAVKIYKKAGTYSYYQPILEPLISDRIGIDCLRVADLDGDGTAEIVTGQNGLTIYRYDYELFNLVKLYNFGLGGTFEIK